MRRVLSIFLPLWPVERIARRHCSPGRREPSRALLVISTSAGRQLVEHACMASLRAGVRPGMTVAHARALLGEHTLLLSPHEPDQDRIGLDVLARWAERWSPVVSVDVPDGLVLDLTGCEHLFGGEVAMVTRIVRAVSKLRLSARFGVASTVGAAWAVARYGPRSCQHVESGGEQAALERLPLGALRIEAAIVHALGEVGVRSIGEMLALPRSSLPARYGPELIRRTDQALGNLPEPVYRLPEHVEFKACIELPGGTTSWESVQSASRDGLIRLTQLLEQRGVGLRRMDVVCDRIDHGQAALMVRVSRATRCVKHLWSLLRPRLERMQMGEGVERITFAASAIAAVTQRQESFLARDRSSIDEAGFAQTLDVIANRIGRDRVLVPVLHASHRPERAFGLEPVVDQAVSVASPVTPPPNRPSRLIEPPEPVRVMALWPDGPVGRVWRGGVELDVLLCIGPERLGGEWWREQEPSRDYFRVQDERGVWLWLFRESRSGAWYLHGEWA